MVRTAGLFQGLVAVPVMLVMGESVFEHLFWWYYYTRVYNFILAFFNALFAAGIVFIIFIQRQPIQSAAIRLYLELAKSACATAVWIWLLLDSIFGPQRGYYYNPPSRPRAPKIISAALSVFVLLIVFYPTLVYAIVDKSHEDNAEVPEAGEAGPADEQTPLLE